MLDEWSGDDTEELFELLESQMADIGIDLKFREAALAAHDEDDDDLAPRPEGEEPIDDEEDEDEEDKKKSHNAAHFLKSIIITLLLAGFTYVLIHNLYYKNTYSYYLNILLFEDKSFLSLS